MKPTKLGLGFMRHDLSGNSQRIVDYAMANGINYFETCYFYLNHECENFVYSLLKPYARSTYEICGKLSMNEAFSENVNYKDMYYEQLKRVPQGYFDVYILQVLAPKAYHQIYCSDLIDFFTKEKEKGNIVKFGFSE
jgi:predicted aldo/keto reductase-like oxidoreductase